MVSGLFSRMARESTADAVLFTHVIFEVGAGAAQQEHACALGVAVLAGQVQGRVPRLGERREKGGHVSMRCPADLHEQTLQRDWTEKRHSSHSLLPDRRTRKPGRGFRGRTLN